MVKGKKTLIPVGETKTPISLSRLCTSFLTLERQQKNYCTYDIGWYAELLMG